MIAHDEWLVERARSGDTRAFERLYREHVGKATPVVVDSETADVEGVETEWTLETPLEVREIEKAIEELPDGARDVLVLYGIYGYSHSETAEMLGVAEGTCKAQLHRARGLLRARLGGSPA
jgi:RNA polymerase sigma factor (sigma-70 family)